MPDYIIFLIIFAAALVSGFAQVVTGFGYAIVMMAVLPVFLPGAVATTVSIIGGASIGVWMLYYNIKYFKFKTLFLSRCFRRSAWSPDSCLGRKSAPSFI